MTSSSTVKEESADEYVERTEFSLFTLVGELSRYMKSNKVKGDNMIEDEVVKAKAAAAEEIATESSMKYNYEDGSSGRK